MKKLLIIPMLLVCFVSYGQTLDPNSIIGNPKKIGDVLVAQHDFPKMMNWDDATAACAALGNGWRLPSQDELNILYQNSNEIGGFEVAMNNSNYYWSSSEFSNGFAWIQFFGNGDQTDDNKNATFYARAVRSF